MKRVSYPFEVITPALAGGAQPKQRAEIRPASIRGQLRWWFRVLGGFKSQSGSVRSREAEVFGSISNDSPHASKLVVRVSNAPASSAPRTMEDLGAAPFSKKGYLLWPLRRDEDARATVPPGSKFELQILWKGDARLWPSIQALIAVFANLGSLGFRGRRAMGALACTSSIPLAEAISFFASPTNISVKAMAADSADQALSQLGGWLKSWRAYGRTGQNDAEQGMPGFKWAKSDHDLGAAILSRNPSRPQSMYRAAIGLPLNQRFQRDNLDWKPAGAGRFASPVLLRPHRTASGQWKALVIFVHNHEWPSNEHITADRGGTVSVSLDLLKAMQADPNLTPLH
jgi:CRISPR type III-B/RAMP module RAMP protein Cmr1